RRVPHVAAPSRAGLAISARKWPDGAVAARSGAVRRAGTGLGDSLRARPTRPRGGRAPRGRGRDETKPVGNWRSWRTSERLEVFDELPALVVGEVGAVVVAGVRIAGYRLALVVLGAVLEEPLGVGLEADVDRVEGAGPDRERLDPLRGGQE